MGIDATRRAMSCERSTPDNLPLRSVRITGIIFFIDVSRNFIVNCDHRKSSEISNAQEYDPRRPIILPALISREKPSTSNFVPWG